MQQLVFISGANCPLLLVVYASMLRVKSNRKLRVSVAFCIRQQIAVSRYLNFHSFYSIPVLTRKLPAADAAHIQ